MAVLLKILCCAERIWLIEYRQSRFSNQTMKRSSLLKLYVLFFILVAAAGTGFYLFHTRYSAHAGSPELELDRLLGNNGIVKMPHATQPVEIQLDDISGNSVSLSQFRGKIVFLNFWATWCPTCVVEMPSMERLHRRLKDRDFVMVAVNLKENRGQVKSFFEKYKLSFTTLLDTGGEVAYGLAVNALPTTFVLDRAGRIIGMALGPREWDHQASIELFEFLINRRSDQPGTQSG